MVILSIIFAIIGIAIFILLLFTDDGEYKEYAFWGLVGGAILFLIFFIPCTFFIVEPGEVGIQILFGKIVSYSESGFHAKNPLADVTKMDLRTQIFEDKLEAASSDLQEIDINIAVNYRLNSESIDKLYNQVGKDYVIKVVTPAIQELAKFGVSQFPIADVVLKRKELSDNIFKMLSDRFSKYYLVLETVNLKNILFKPEYSAAVQQKQIEEQNIKTAEYKKLQAKETAAQQVIQAEADAETTRINAKAEAEKQRLLASSTSKDVIELKWIEAWDGKLPTYMMGSGDRLMPVLNLNK